MKRTLLLLISLLAICTAVSAQTIDGRNFGIDGFAAYAGTAGTQWYHAGGTTGGEGGKVVKADTFSELQAYLQSSKPYIILVDHDITTGIKCYVDASVTYDNICAKQDGTEGTETTYGERVMVASNKTLIGITKADGTAPTISRITFVMQCAHNIIFRNLRFTMLNVPVKKDGENKIVAMRNGEATLLSDPDCIGIQADAVSASKDSGSHIWIDHCEFFNGNANHKDRYDGLIDCKNNVQWITISYNYFHDHYKACLWGKGKSDIYTNCRTISCHHNSFDHVKSGNGKEGSRLPLQRGGNLHYMNNYMNDCLDGWDLRASAVSYADACYFKDSKAPILPDGEEDGKLTICKEPGYGIIYDNCRRVIKSPQDGITYKNAPEKYDSEYDLATYNAIGTWVPTDTWADYFVNNRVKADDVPSFIEKYTGAGKIGNIWQSYAAAIPSYSQTDLQEALDSPRTLTTASGSATYYTYDSEGNKMTVAPAPTAIYNITNISVSSNNSDIYNVIGVKIASPQKGQLYIKNGKKVIF